jgi:hypothetical protein
VRQHPAGKALKRIPAGCWRTNYHFTIPQSLAAQQF